MKKITLVLAFIGMITLSGCTVNEVVERDIQDNDTISEVFELSNVNFVYYNSTGLYEIRRSLNPEIFSSDQVLIYRMSYTINPTTPVWQLIPRTLYFNNGDELDYDYEFSRINFKITAGGNFDLNTRPEYITDETFRIVIIPGYFSGKFDVSDYNKVMQFYGLSESDVKVLK